MLGEAVSASRGVSFEIRVTLQLSQASAVKWHVSSEKQCFAKLDSPAARVRPIPVSARASREGIGEEKRKVTPHRRRRICRYVRRRRHFAEGPPMAASPAFSQLEAIARRSNRVRSEAGNLISRRWCVRTSMRCLPAWGRVPSGGARRPRRGLRWRFSAMPSNTWRTSMCTRQACCSSIHSRDPRVEAMQLLMAANRQVYYACPLVPSLYQRI